MGPVVDDGEDDWPQQLRWDMWDVDPATSERSLVTTLPQLFRTMMIENDTNAHKRAAMLSFLELPVASVMPAALRKEVDEFLGVVVDEEEEDIVGQ